MKRDLTLILLALSLALASAACGDTTTDDDDDDEITKETARQRAERGDRRDYCAEEGWYDDGECDDFCIQPDPDCDEDEPEPEGEPEDEVCAEIFAPVCGEDGNTYGNLCEAERAGVRVAHEGECELACTAEFAPVCGVDGNTYGNACEANRAGVEIAHEGECRGEEGACGGIQGLSCPEDQFCQYAPGDICGAADQLGTCVVPPEVCPQIFAPVCGCDGNTSGNACEAAASRVSVVSEGECEEACTEEFAPVCGVDGNTYGNACEANRAGVEIAHEGECRGEEGACGGIQGLECPRGLFCQFTIEQTCGAADHLGVCVERPEACIEIFAPVCGCDGNTYDNSCFAQAAGVSVAAEGACDEPEPADCGGIRGLICERGLYCHFEIRQQCGNGDQLGTCRERPEACIEIFDPVCGCDGLTYSNSCHAAEAGVSIIHEGECRPEPEGCFGPLDCGRDQYCDFPDADACGLFLEFPGTCAPRPEICPQVFAPVCGCDGVTYSNDCVAASSGANVLHEGECEGDPEPQTCGGFLGVVCEDRGTFCQFTIEQFCGNGDQTGVCVGRPEACIEIFDPVCGCDGVTYSNACFAQAAGVSVAAEGECRN